MLLLFKLTSVQRSNLLTHSFFDVVKFLVASVFHDVVGATDEFAET